MTKIDDIELMAYLDGELGEAEALDVERAIQDSSDVRERVEALRRTIDAVRDTYSPVLEAPVPDHLISTIENYRAPAENVEHRKGGWRQQGWMRLAASVCLGIALGAGGMNFVDRAQWESEHEQRLADALAARDAEAEWRLVFAEAPWETERVQQIAEAQTEPASIGYGDASVVFRGAGDPDAAPDAGATKGPTSGPSTFREPERLAAFEEQLPAVFERTANGVTVTMTLSPTVVAEITPVESFLATSGTFCRKARYQPVKQEASPPTYFTACRADSGMWEVVSISSPADE